MTNIEKNVCLQVFARAPVRGRVKSRLMAALGADKTLDLYRWLLQRSLHSAAAVSVAARELWLSEPVSAAESTLWPPVFCHYVQQGESLGERMGCAMQQGLSRQQGVVLMGCDCPGLDQAYLQTAVDALRQGYSAVLGPAVDGGYVLLGLSSYEPALFGNLPWGSDRVLDLTLSLLNARGYRVNLLKPLQDIDRVSDLEALRPLLPPHLQ